MEIKFWDTRNNDYADINSWDKDCSVVDSDGFVHVIDLSKVGRCGTYKDDVYSSADFIVPHIYINGRRVA